MRSGKAPVSDGPAAHRDTKAHLCPSHLAEVEVRRRSAGCEVLVCEVDGRVGIRVPIPNARPGYIAWMCRAAVLDPSACCSAQPRQAGYVPGLAGHKTRNRVNRSGPQTSPAI